MEALPNNASWTVANFPLESALEPQTVALGSMLGSNGQLMYRSDGKNTFRGFLTLILTKCFFIYTNMTEIQFLEQLLTTELRYHSIDSVRKLFSSITGRNVAGILFQNDRFVPIVQTKQIKFW